MGQVQKRNVTLSLSPQVIKKARILAVKRSTSISGLLSEHIEKLVSDDEAYEAARRDALALMKRGFHLGGGPYASREELHER